MGAIVMTAANDGKNHEASYGHEHEKKKRSERHYIPLPFSIRDSQRSLAFCQNCSSRMLSSAAAKDTCQFRGDAMPEFPSENADGQKTSE